MIFVPAERLGDAAALDDREHRLLDGGEPLAALRAGPTTADQLTVVGLAGIDHAGVGVPAVRAPHGCLLAIMSTPQGMPNRPPLGVALWITCAEPVGG
jgi:hypothetical protein